MSDFLNIKGLGAKRIELLRDVGIVSMDDLAAFFPIAYYDLDETIHADATHMHCVLKGRLVKAPFVRYIRKGLSIARLECVDEWDLPFNVIFYNRPYIKNQVFRDAEYYFFGDLTFDKTYSMLNPLMEHIEEVVPKGCYTVYPAISGIPKAVLKNAILDCVSKTRFQSIFTDAERKTCELLDVDYAYRALHVPSTVGVLALAQRTVAIEELTQLMLMFRLKKVSSNRWRSFRYSASLDILKEKLGKLPFEPTNCQLRAIDDVLTDLHSNRRMNRLIQGDVGSGKTLVAFLAMAYVAASGHQVSLMAPTEVLAAQHYDNYCKLFGEDGVVCLTGGLLSRQKMETQSKIARGDARVIIGTHSLFQSKVEYPHLGLVITDEQQRFGVAQRAAIEDKGRNADALIMSATPIPRTMALLLYGDLDYSVLDSKPMGRKEIITKIVPSYKRAQMFQYLREDASQDRRTYIVVPRVDSKDDETISAKTVYKELSQGVFKNINMGLLYGAMKEKDKSSVLNDFSQGRTKILVSTTVIEVGVDVKKACNMVILDADRFGLAQLHQLRGRVGRGVEQSYCFLLTDNESDAVKTRLNYLTMCADGFAIADYDLESRGAGDFIGMSQHGFTGGISHLPIGKAEIEVAKQFVEQILASGEPLERLLKEKYAKLVKNVTMN